MVRQNRDGFGNCGRNGRTALSVQFTNDIGLVNSSSDLAQPSVYEFGEPRPGDDIGNQMEVKTTKATA